MSRHGAQYGPDLTFLGVDAAGDPSFPKVSTQTGASLDEYVEGGTGSHWEVAVTRFRRIRPVSVYSSGVPGLSAGHRPP